MENTSETPNRQGSSDMDEIHINPIEGSVRNVEPAWVPWVDPDVQVGGAAFSPWNYLIDYVPRSMNDVATEPEAPSRNLDVIHANPMEGRAHNVEPAWVPWVDPDVQVGGAAFSPWNYVPRSMDSTANRMTGETVNHVTDPTVNHVVEDTVHQVTEGSVDVATEPEAPMSGRIALILASMFGRAQQGTTAPQFDGDNGADNTMNQLYVQQGAVALSALLPASEEVMNNLEDVSITPDHIETTPRCCICMEEFILEETTLILPVCHHVFHAECIKEWLSINGTCPVCRQSYSA